LWVTHFPMFERSSDGGWKAAHHPFTAPLAADEPLVRLGGPAALHARARSYDMVLNGVELGGGSVRIHDPALQLAALELIGVSAEKAKSTMGHLLTALSMGAPPHAGLAFGLDRLMMQLLGAASLKDVIAFPKAADGKEIMVGSPARIEN
jgi:aspartyl-tRNA synthetase